MEVKTSFQRTLFSSQDNMETYIGDLNYLQKISFGSVYTSKLVFKNVTAIIDILQSFKLTIINVSVGRGPARPDFTRPGTLNYCCGKKLEYWHLGDLVLDVGAQPVN